MDENPRPDLWRHTVGEKGINRVTVYERVAGGPIQVEWWDNDGRHRETLRNSAGIPVKDHALAQAIAEAMAAAQRKRREAGAVAEFFGRPKRRTIAELFVALHAAREASWSEQHARDQRRFREFWTAALGGTTALDAVTPAKVEQAVAIGARAKKWSSRTQQAYLRYIVDAFYYARTKQKWITEAHDLRGVTMPEVRSESKSYTRGEVLRILEHAPKVDLRPAAAGEIAYSTQRRLSAIRTLPASAYRAQDVDGITVGVITFPRATDKARTRGEAVLGARARALVEQLLETPAVKASGLLFPEGDLNDLRPNRQPVGVRQMIDWWHDAERLAKVPVVRGRAYHGVKRRAVTDAVRAMAGDVSAVSKQSGTLGQTLTAVYEQDDLDAKIELAKRLDAQRRGA